LNPLKVGGAIRFGLILQDPDQTKNMNEFHLDPGHYSNAVELRLHGDVTDYFSWTANFNAVLNGDGVGAANNGPGFGSTFADFSIEDLIAQFKAVPEFQIWAGRLLVPSDRTNFSGPFFSSPWNYQGFYLKNAAPIGPIEGANGRNQGITVWGNAFDDKFKYYGGVYGIDQGGPNSTSAGCSSALDQCPNPFYSARVSYTFQGSEPGYFGSSTYYGEKSVTTLGAGFQYQKGGAVTATGAPKAVEIGMADFLTEQAVPGAGTFTFEGQFYAFPSGYNFGDGAGIFSPREAFYGLVSYLTPENVGIGKIQPLLRWQQTVNPAWTIVDAALAYVMKAYDARLVLTYEHIDTGSTGGPGGGISNSLQFGVQLQK
jgi:hypothetical protein